MNSQQFSIHARSGEVSAASRSRLQRGRPLIMLCAVLLSWASARLALWESPLPQVFDAMSTQVFAEAEKAAELPAQSDVQRGMGNSDVATTGQVLPHADPTFGGFPPLLAAPAYASGLQLSLIHI